METRALPPQMRPMASGGQAQSVVAVLAGVVTAGWLYACLRLWLVGHSGLGTESYGAVWGITVANIVHVIGISHVGIAISATVRVLGLSAYRNIARIAEVVTIVALITAVLNIAIDVGRPDRFLTHTLFYGRWDAPMVWSMTVITVYLLASGVYLYLSLRPDLAALASLGGRRGRFYRLLALGYGDTPQQRQRHRKTLFWVAISLVPIMVSVHSVYGLFFGLMLSRPGWFNPLQAPYFVLGAIVSGFSAIVVIAALLRRAYNWRELLPDRTFRVFGAFLAFVVFLYLYFMFSEHLTAQWAGPASERAISSSLLHGAYAPLFWFTTIGGLLVPFVILFLQVIRKTVNPMLIAIAALAINVAMWSKRFLLVLPAQFQPHLPPPRPLVDYAPTANEIFLTLGSLAVAVFLFLVLLRWVPLIELDGSTRSEDGVPAAGPERSRSALRSGVVIATLAAGVFFVTWGILTREYDLAPLKWLIGFTLLIAIPLEICLIPDAPPAPQEEI